MADAIELTFVSSHSKSGGSERYLETLVQELGDGWLREIVCLEDGPLVERLRAQGRPLAVVPTGAAAASLVRAARTLRARKPTLVHANGVKAALVAALAGVPFVWIKHDVSWDGPLGAFIALRARRVIGVSEFVTARLPRRAMVAVVPPGLELPTPGAAPDPTAFGLPAGARVVLAAGLLNPIKGQRDLVEALPAIRARVPAAALALAGGDDASVPGERDRLAARAGELGLADAVVLLGHRKDAVELMRAADAVVVATQRGEGFGLVSVEALAVGVPVIGYDVGALREIAGDAALFVPPGDIGALADAIARVLADDALRASLAAAGAARIRDRYTVDRWISSMREQYLEAA